MDPVSLACATSSSSCARVAAAPVGLLGEQKKMMSDFFAGARSGKNEFSALQARYAMLPYCLVASSKPFVWPVITEESTYAG